MNQELAELLFPDVKMDVTEIEAQYPPRQLDEKAMVTRFAPSPTGFMHVGNLCGAFIDFVFAQQSKGVFYLRIEDTDSKREVAGAVEAILQGLKDFGIAYQEGYPLGGAYGPYVQSKRVPIYQAYVKKMVAEGYAYPCFMTEEEIANIRAGQELRKEKIGIYGHYAVDRDLSLEEVKAHLEKGDAYVIRLKSPGDSHKEVILHDLVKGDIVLPENEIDHPLLKKDGIPTYHLAHVIDDHLMHTTHVVRGDEWVPSFPFHLQLTKILGFKMPKYVHVAPLTKKEDGKIRKLSKRKDPEFAVSYYAEKGIPKEAVKLYLATLINTNFEEWYIQNQDKSIADFTFSFKKMPTGGTLFDMEKLSNISRTYFSRLTAEKIYEDALVYYKKYDAEFYDLLVQFKEKMIAFLDIERNGKRPRKDIATYLDIKKESWYLFDHLFYQEGVYASFLEEPADILLLQDYCKVYRKEDTQEEWYQRIQKLAEENGYAPSIKMYKKQEQLYKGHIGDICEAIRHVLTARSRTPNLYELLQIIGIEEFEKRIAFYQKQLLRK